MNEVTVNLEKLKEELLIFFDCGDMTVTQMQVECVLDRVKRCTTATVTKDYKPFDVLSAFETMKKMFSSDDYKAWIRVNAYFYRLAESKEMAEIFEKLMDDIT